MDNQEKKEVKVRLSTVIYLIIILILIAVVAILFYQNTQNKIKMDTELNELKNEIAHFKEQENQIQNEVINNTVASNVDTNIVNDVSNKVTTNANNSTKKLKKFEFNTPVGETGVFTIYAEKALQASGFSGASAHIYYLKEGDLYYHNEDDKDTKLASGITDLKQQGEDIIAVKGNNAKIYVENAYIQYQ